MREVFYQIWFGAFLLLFSCLPVNKTSTPVEIPESSTSKPSASESKGPVGLLALKLSTVSENTVCVYGGWYCPNGDTTPLLQCSMDSGNTFSTIDLASEKCSALLSAQVSQDGSSLWFACQGVDKAPYFLYSQDGGTHFRLSDPLLPQGDLVAWNFSNNNEGVIVLAPDKSQEKEIPFAYIERTTKDGGSTWQTILEIPYKDASQFTPDTEVGSSVNPIETKKYFSSFRKPGRDGGPAYEIRNAQGQKVHLIAWDDIPSACSEESFALPDTPSNLSNSLFPEEL